MKLKINKIRFQSTEEIQAELQDVMKMLSRSHFHHASVNLGKHFIYSHFTSLLPFHLVLFVLESLCPSPTPDIGLSSGLEWYWQVLGHFLLALLMVCIRLFLIQKCVYVLCWHKLCTLFKFVLFNWYTNNSHQCMLVQKISPWFMASVHSKQYFILP
jgi:hypothetical protein